MVGLRWGAGRELLMSRRCLCGCGEGLYGRSCVCENLNLNLNGWVGLPLPPPHIGPARRHRSLACLPISKLCIANTAGVCPVC